MSAAPLDPRSFAADALAARGALVEDALAVLPAELARELEQPEELSLEAASSGLGGALLERLVDWAREGVPRACARLSPDVAPRVAQASSLASRFVVRNAVTSVERAFPTEAVYVVAYLAWSAEADDRHAGVVRVAANATDGSVPAASFVGRVDVRFASELEAAEVLDRTFAEPAERALAAAARVEVEPRAAVLAAAARRRHLRDHARISEYFEALAGEARSPRRKMEPAAIEAKLAQLVAEGDAKLRDLVDRYAVRVAIAPAALVLVTAPCVEVRVRVRRRKAAGELALRLPPYSLELDALSCAACARPTSRPAVCDDRLHPLCEACVPSGQGRPACGACAKGR